MFLLFFMACVVSLGSQKWISSVNERLDDFDNFVNFDVEKISYNKLSQLVIICALQDCMYIVRRNFCCVIFTV
jgi:hypothetical protein